MITFWNWLVSNSESRSGIRKLVNRWLCIHILIGFLMTLVVPVTLKDAANALLLPLAGIFIGLSFAWGGNSQALLQTEEVERLSEFHSCGFIEYAYTFQMAILVIILTLVLWGLAGLGVFDSRWPTRSSDHLYSAVSIGMYAMASMTVRECWQVTLGAQYLLVMRREIRKKS